MTLYNDDKSWKQHYDDWVRILPTIVPVPELDPRQISYRRKIISNLIDEYKNSH